jgi:hypothetical protein
MSPSRCIFTVNKKAIFKLDTYKLCKNVLKDKLHNLKKSLVGLAPGVNFTNFLQVYFMLADLESAKNTVKASVFFALLRSARVKAARKMLMTMLVTKPVSNRFPSFRSRV